MAEEKLPLLDQVWPIVLPSSLIYPVPSLRVIVVLVVVVSDMRSLASVTIAAIDASWANVELFLKPGLQLHLVR
jgi:hypothetical protein